MTKAHDLTQFDNQRVKDLKNDQICKFNPGDTIEVVINIFDNQEITRTQVFSGVCIAIKNNSVASNFIVRKVLGEHTIEKTFFFNSNVVKSIKVLIEGDVRRSKLYYLRTLSGKAARIKQKRHFRSN